jgi:hypothetical protein
MDPSDVTNLAAPMLIALAVASRGFRLDEGRVGAWAASAGLELTDERRRQVRRYLAWSRRSRTVGGLIGFLAPAIYARVVVDRSDDGGWSMGSLVAGYLVGAVVAEIVVDPPGSSPRGTKPAGRAPGDHLSARAAFLQRGLGVLSAVLGLSYAVLEPHARLAVPDPATVGAVGLTGIGIAAVVEALQRGIIGRPPAPDSDAALDGAMRWSSVHVLAGAAIALLLNVVGLLLSALATMAGTAGSVVGLVLFLTLFVSSIAVWRDLGKPRGFMVRRPEDQAAIR